MRSTTLRGSLVVAVLVAAIAGGASPRTASSALPPGNSVQQWNKIAEDRVVGAGAFQTEGWIYMAYVQTAVYDAAKSTRGDEHRFSGSGTSTDAAVVEAAYRVLSHYLPTKSRDARCDPTPRRPR